MTGTCAKCGTPRVTTFAAKKGEGRICVRCLIKVTKKIQYRFNRAGRITKRKDF